MRLFEKFQPTVIFMIQALVNNSSFCGGGGTRRKRVSSVFLSIALVMESLMYARRGPQTPFRVRPQETAQCNLHFQEKAKVKATKRNFVFLPKSAIFFHVLNSILARKFKVILGKDCLT